MDSAAMTTVGLDEDEFSVPELGATFSPFNLYVKKGEDVLERIMAMAGPDQGVCVIVAVGGVSSFTVKQPGASSSPLVYQGYTQILRLQGLYLPLEKGGPLAGRLKFLGGLLEGQRPKPFIEGDVCGKVIADFEVNVCLGLFKVDFEKLHQLDRDRILEAAPPILERERVFLTDTRAVKRSRPYSDWSRMSSHNCSSAIRFLAPEAGPLGLPYQRRHPPPPRPPPAPTTEERVKQLEKEATELKDQIQQLKREAADREERAMEREKRLKQEFSAMLQQQLTSASSTTGSLKMI